MDQIYYSCFFLNPTDEEKGPIPIIKKLSLVMKKGVKDIYLIFIININIDYKFFLLKI